MRAGYAFTLAAPLLPNYWPDRREALFHCLVSLAGGEGERLLYMPPLPGSDMEDLAQFEACLRQQGWEHRRARLLRWVAVLVARHADDIRAVAWLLRSDEPWNYQRISGERVMNFLEDLSAARETHPETSERERVLWVVDRYTRARPRRPARKQARIDRKQVQVTL
jgi:hypothetical protein